MRTTMVGVGPALLLDVALAQEVPAPGGLRPSPETTRPALPEFREQPAPEFELPPVPAPRERLSTGIRVFVKTFRITGNTVFDDAALLAVVASFTGRAITTEELLEARDALTRYYLERGYVNSGAVIPDQTVEEGVIAIEIVEGRLGEIRVTGLTSLRPAFVEDRIRLGVTTPLDVEPLRERIQLLLSDPAVDRVDAQLGPGEAPGESRLDIDVLEAPRYQFGARLANDRSPSVGAENGEISVQFGNLFGRSDPLRASLTISEGLRDFEAGYSVPLTPRDLRLFATGETINTDVVEEPFSEIDVESSSWSLQAGLSYPAIRTLDDELLLGASLERKRSTTLLLGRRFSFSEGVRDGRSDITAFRFVQQWTHRTRERVLALRSTASLGVDLLGATVNPGDTPDGRFLAWLAQAQFAQRLFADDWQVNLRGDLQLTTNPLLPIERIAIGGMDTVRGYRQNQLVLDNGWVLSAEMRMPMARLPVPQVSVTPDDGTLQLISFVDAGGGWNMSTPNPPESTIYSVGTGLRWRINARTSFRLDIGIPIRDVPDPEDRNLQDLGIHFELRTLLF